MEIKRMGLDLAKSVFEVHGVDEQGKTVLHKTLKRKDVLSFFAQLPPCPIGMEAGGGAHHWARSLREQGHEVRLMAPQFVRPYRKSGKSDRNDAEAICEAVGRPSMRFVAVKSAEQQAVLVMHRARQLAVGQRTALGNQMRGLLAEFGIVIRQGRAPLRQALPLILEDAENGLPFPARATFADLYAQLVAADERVASYDRRIQALAQTMPGAQRLMQVEGVGAITATAVVATVGDAKVFQNGRQMAAWLGLTPRQSGSGGKLTQGHISKRGDGYVRMLLVHGARAVLRTAHRKTDPKSRWVSALKDRAGANKAVVALAAKQARILWVLLAREQDYQPARAA